jgi:hypothetical protein
LRETYRHAATDFVKQSASPSPNNPARRLKRNNSDALRDELARHVEEDDVMSSFDFGLQLLDAEKMTYWGERRDASFWIENASVEWKESQAPFFTVARLTLEPKSRISGTSAEKVFFDVIRNALPESVPVGSINRARWAGEFASRKARMGV